MNSEKQCFDKALQASSLDCRKEVNFSQMKHRNTNLENIIEGLNSPKFVHMHLRGFSQRYKVCGHYVSLQ